MALIIWSGSKESTLKKIISPVITRTMVEHKVVPNLTQLPPANPGDVVLVCGTKPFELLQELKWFPKNRSASSCREQPILQNGVTYLVTFDPHIANIDYARLPEIQWDVTLACRIVKTGSPKPKLGNYRWVDSLHEMIERISQAYARTGKPVEVAADIETTGLDEYRPGAYIVSIFFSDSVGMADGLYFKKGEKPRQPDPWDPVDSLDYWEGLWVQLNWLLTSPMVSLRGANWKFDSRWIVLHWLIFGTNYNFDTTLVGSLLDENRSNSLKLHIKQMTDLGGYEDGMKNHDIGHVENVPLDELLVYAGGDADGTLQVSKVMREELLKDKRLSNFYVNLLHPSGKTFEVVERNGVLVDVPYYKKLQHDLEKEIKSLHYQMLEQVPHKLRIKYSDKIADQLDSDKSPFTPALLKEFLFTPNGLNLKPNMFTASKGEPSTTQDHLMTFDEIPEAHNFIELYKQLGSASKTLSTYVVGFLRHLRSDGRFHGSYMLFKGDYDGEDDSGTNSGRTSCKDPALQTIPKHTKWTKRLRRAFIPPKGMNILQLDFSQGELRIAAVVAEEPTMIEAYANDKDLHSITAAGLNGYEIEEFMALPDDLRDALRSSGKAGNFGLLYGMGAEGFRIYAKTSYGVIMTPQEAVAKRDAFFATYPRLVEWHKEYKMMASKLGYIRSPLGRMRHLPLINSSDSGVRSKAERQSVNAPIQATLSDMMQLAMVGILREYGNEVIQMFMMTHDSVGVYVPIGEEQLWAKRLTSIMENLPLKEKFGWDSCLKFPVDAEAAVPDDEGVLSFAGLKKIKKEKVLVLA
jgi:DNA polymerase I-like protein with 3'-5' exonuclease and polymerase domains